ARHRGGVVGRAAAPGHTPRAGQRRLGSRGRRGGGAPAEARVPFGELALLTPSTSGAWEVSATPERGFDLGLGRGRPLEARVPAGEVGLIVDTRGRRPFALTGEAGERIARLRAWNRALGLYPREL